MEKKNYFKPEVEILSMATECEILAASGNPGEEVDEGDNAARPTSGTQAWSSSYNVFDE